MGNSTFVFAEQDLRRAYDKKIQECFALEETVDILNAKLRRMRHLLQLKDMRINELQSKLEHISSA
ncbi:unnamed protein product [Mesocestoides corti]|uniref:DUF465 domain-containing protein n=1 Tax=Mesocestoides corti TaxID=53468 RepID=A0A0R3UFK2_MESCO|nr:unnamed protein product [Mesocestoides corti]